MDEPLIKTLRDCYKAASVFECSDEVTTVEADFIHTECDQICNGILRVLHEIAPATYLECVAFSVQQLEPREFSQPVE